VQLSESFLSSLRKIESFDEAAFLLVHQENNPPVSIRLNPLKPISKFHNFPIPQLNIVPWCKHGYYLTERPSFTFDPLFHAGCYYVQEASSMFLEEAIRQTVDITNPIKALDLCAAPGGKSTLIQSLLSKDSLLVSNEVIQSRVKVLKDNLVRWGTGNSVVTSNDPVRFQSLANYFDLIVVDAPCSGSGLFRRSPEATGEWSEKNVELCSQRQQRILAQVIPALKPGGILIYSTCSFSKEEDEEIVDWLLKELPVAFCPLNVDRDWGIDETGKGYRFWPDKIKGEGFFLACLRKSGNDPGEVNTPSAKFQKLSGQEISLIEPWISKGEQFLIKNGRNVHAIDGNLAGIIAFLQQKLHVKYYGVELGQFYPGKFVPAHALALSGLLNPSVPDRELYKETAIQYLQRKNIQLKDTQAGWSTVSFQGHRLGWINILPGRINNYYPKELRILKDLPAADR
jgi:16S rRNA C967 or C1407 C5-methylase (RsmB/RsmF family)/NOL1/NOP2/fmu family ribosome biogenesis protein